MLISVQTILISAFTDFYQFVDRCVHSPCRSAYVATSTPLASWRSQPLTTKHRPVLQKQKAHYLPLFHINIVARVSYYAGVRYTLYIRSRIYFNLPDCHGLASKLTGHCPPSCASNPKEVSSTKLIVPGEIMVTKFRICAHSRKSG